jgi:hypothetical protein
MTEAVTIVDPTTPIRDWLRGQSLAVSTRVYCDGFPKNLVMPACAFSRIGGPISNVFDLGLYQFDIRAETMPAAKTAAAELMTLLLSTFEEELSPSPNGVRMGGASIASSLPIIDPDDPSSYRMTVTAQITTIHIP